MSKNFYRLRHIPAVILVVSSLIMLLFPVSRALGESRTSIGLIYLPVVSKHYRGGPGIMTGLVVDALFNTPINGALVCADESHCDITDEDGTYRLENVDSGLREVEASRDSYLPLTLSIFVQAGAVTTLDFALSPALGEGEFRIVVTWGKEPKDLDAHFWLPYKNYPHVYLDYPGNCNAHPYTCLDRDDKDGYGPETISISMMAWQGTYAYAVLNYNFGHPGVPEIIDSSAKVQVYGSEGLIAQFNIPENGEGDLWYVFDLDAVTGDVIAVNCITYYPSDPDRPQCSTNQAFAAGRYDK